MSSNREISFSTSKKLKPNIYKNRFKHDFVFNKQPRVRNGIGIEMNKKQIQHEEISKSQMPLKYAME